MQFAILILFLFLFYQRLERTPGDKPGLMGMAMTFEAGKMSGNTWFDADQGYPVENALKQEFTLKMEMPNPQNAEKEKVTMTMPMVQDISMKLVEVGKVK